MSGSGKSQYGTDIEEREIQYTPYLQSQKTTQTQLTTSQTITQKVYMSEKEGETNVWRQCPNVKWALYVSLKKKCGIRSNH